MKLQVNISEAEGMAIKELAKKDTRSVSSYIRKIILEKLKETENGTGE